MVQVHAGCRVHPSPARPIRPRRDPLPACRQVETVYNPHGKSIGVRPKERKSEIDQQQSEDDLGGSGSIGQRQYLRVDSLGLSPQGESEWSC